MIVPFHIVAFHISRHQRPNATILMRYHSIRYAARRGAARCGVAWREMKAFETSTDEYIYLVPYAIIQVRTSLVCIMTMDGQALKKQMSITSNTQKRAILWLWKKENLKKSS
jgi:hypothetical protein